MRARPVDEFSYSGKAFLCTAMAQRVQLWGLWLDCMGVGELGVAKAAGIRRERILVHGVNKYVAFIAVYLVTGCRRRDLLLPKLRLEPGRSMVARAAVALYQVASVKHVQQHRWLLLDSGTADIPRPGRYGARYSGLPVVEPQRPASGPAWLAGPYCERGDVLIQALPLLDVQPGELITVPVNGAHHLSMASTYNGACGPPVLWLHEGAAHLVQQREQVDDLFRRDLRLWTA